VTGTADPLWQPLTGPGTGAEALHRALREPARAGGLSPAAHAMTAMAGPAAAGRSLVSDLRLRYFFHGGQPGLRPGDEILPSGQTGVVTLDEIVREHDPAGYDEMFPCPTRPDRVYVTDRSVVAYLFAAQWSVSPFCEGSGTVYRVRPRGRLEPDPGTPDADGTVRAWMCEAAVVERVISGDVPAGLAASCGYMREAGDYLRCLHRARAEGRQLRRRADPPPCAAGMEGAGTGVAAWRCWALAGGEPGVLASLLAPASAWEPVLWAPGPGWQPDARCRFHGHPAPDASRGCGRCGWRGEPSLRTLCWWLADWKAADPAVIGRVELGGEILRGDPAHPEIPGILRAGRIRVAGPLVVGPVPGQAAHARALAEAYGVTVYAAPRADALLARLSRSWVRELPAALAAAAAGQAAGAGALRCVRQAGDGGWLRDLGISA
jgi:hypothetical protein